MVVLRRDRAVRFDQPAFAERSAHALVGFEVGRPPDTGERAGRSFDRGLCLEHLVADLRVGKLREVAVRPAVEAEIVTVFERAPKSVLASGDIRPEDEERGPGVVLGEQIQNLRRPLGRSVVEGQSENALLTTVARIHLVSICGRRRRDPRTVAAMSAAAKPSLRGAPLGSEPASECEKAGRDGSATI